MLPFSSPWALASLASLGALIWLWRFAATQRRTVVASLVPFEHLIRRPPARRTRLTPNVLFWLQAAALVLLALALAKPVIAGRRMRTVLVVLDTSMSMAAKIDGETAMDRAKEYLQGRVVRRAGQERVFIVTTAPIDRLLAEPSNDPGLLRQAIERVEAADLPGNLSTAYRIGIQLLGGRVDDSVILTDEPEPAAGLADARPPIEFRSFGKPVPNAAIVGLDTHQSLCQAEASWQPVVWVQNFAEQPQELRLRLLRGRQTLARASTRLEPGAREAVTLKPDLPIRGEGIGEIMLEAGRDALAVDNRARIAAASGERIPVAVTGSPGFVDAMSEWLQACPRLELLERAPEQLGDTNARVLITNQPEVAEAWPSPALIALPTGGRTVTVRHWLLDPTHPISEYLNGLETVTTRAIAEEGGAGEAVIWGLAQGRKLPLVSAISASGRRRVIVRFDLAASADAVPPVVMFFNSLRWLLGAAATQTTGQPLLLSGFEPGIVEIHRPEGGSQPIAHPGGLVRYDATTRAGVYRATQGRRERIVALNAVDAAESNTLQRVSTWIDLPVATVASAPAEAPQQSIVPWLLAALIVLLLAEWALYAWRASKQPLPVPERPQTVEIVA